MSMTMKAYDGMLAVACVVLAVVLNALQIMYIADGLVMASRQGLVSSMLFAIVISSGLFLAMFTGHHLRATSKSRTYSLLLAGLAGTLTGGMAVWSLAHNAEVMSFRWYLSVAIGFSIPAQTIVLCNMANSMFDLAGRKWWHGSELTLRIAGYLFPVDMFQPKQLSQVEHTRIAPNGTPQPQPDPADLQAVLSPLPQSPDPVIVLPESSHTVVRSDRDMQQARQEEPTAAPLPHRFKEPESAPVTVTESIPPAMVAESTAPATVTESTPPVTVADKPAPLLVTEHTAMLFALTGERVTVTVGPALSNRKWKVLHSELRRLPCIDWDGAEKGNSSEGNRTRTLAGTARLPALKGKKNKRKLELARRRHLKAIETKLKEVAERCTKS